MFWWKVWSEHRSLNDEEAKETGFHQNLMIVAVFMTLPLTEILRSYLNVSFVSDSSTTRY